MDGETSAKRRLSGCVSLCPQDRSRAGDSVRRSLPRKGCCDRPLFAERSKGWGEINWPEDPQLIDGRCFQPSLMVKHKLHLWFWLLFLFPFFFPPHIFCRISFKSYHILSSQGVNKHLVSVPSIMTCWGCNGWQRLLALAQSQSQTNWDSWSPDSRPNIATNKVAQSQVAGKTVVAL